MQTKNVSLASAATTPVPIKVMHLITGLGVGGAEMMLAKLMSNIDPRKFRSRVVCLMDPGPLASRIRAAGIPVQGLGLSRGVPNPMVMAKLIGQLREFRPDILQTWLYHADIAGLLAAQLTRVPKVVWNIRCSDLDLNDAHRSLRFLFKAHRALSRFPDATIVNSVSGMHFHQRAGHRARRWELIQNGFDLERFRNDPAKRTLGRLELGLTDDDIAIGMVARFNPQKDHATFIAAAKLLYAREPKAVFVLAGTQMTTENRVVVEQLGNSGLFQRMRLLGEVEDTARLFASLDIATLCSPSGEGFPNALGEAMSTELACVATNIGDSALLLGDAGRLVPLRDPEALAQCWAELIDHPEERRRLGRLARGRIERHYSLPAIVEAYETLYEDLAG